MAKATAEQILAGEIQLQDKVLLEILKNHFQAIVGEMGYAIRHTGHTVYIKETSDFGSILVTPEGEIFSAPLNIGVTVLIGTPVDDAIKAIDQYHEGDICISNDPRTTGAMATHLPDLYLWKPIFYDGELVCFVTTFVHSSDVGGKVPGSISPSSYDLWQEGLILPPTKLFEQGKLNQDVLDIFLANSRIPDENWGDVKAQVAALNIGEKRTHELIDRYGLDTIRKGMSSVLDYSEAQAREIISTIPDGTYRFNDYMEGKVAGLDVVRIDLSLTVQGSDIYLDFGKTDPQVEGSLNMPTGGKRGHWMIVPALVKFFKTENKNITYNSGMVRPIALEAPRGCLVNPEPDAAIGVRAATMFRVFDIISGALLQATPERVPTAGSGQGSIVLVSTIEPLTGKKKVSVVQPLCGGSGGRKGGDGVDGADFSLGSLRNVPNESLESDMPIIIEHYGLRPNSAGAGQWRGGTGVELTVKIMTPHTVMTARGMERYRFRPWGYGGGMPGTTGFTLLSRNGGPFEDIGQLDVLHLRPGDRLHFGTQGAGGYGNPLLRDTGVVAADVLNGIITPELARVDYGVVLLEDGSVDPEATEALRDEMGASRGEAPEFNFGPERAEFEEVWSTAVQDRLMEVIADYPTSLKSFMRWEIRQRISAEAEAGANVTTGDIERVHDELVTELKLNAG